MFFWHDVGFQCSRVSAQRITMKFRKSTVGRLRRSSGRRPASLDASSVYIYIYIYIYMYVYICIYIYIYMYTHIHIYIYIYIHRCMWYPEVLKHLCFCTIKVLRQKGMLANCWHTNLISLQRQTRSPNREERVRGQPFWLKPGRSEYIYWYPKDQIGLNIILRLNELNSSNFIIRLKLHLLANFGTLKFGYALQKRAYNSANTCLTAKLMWIQLN